MTTDKNSSRIQPLLTRGPSARGFLSIFFLAFAIAGVVLVAGLGHWVAAPTAAFAAAGLAPILLAFLFVGIAIRSVRYRLVPDSLEVQRGILGRRIENVQLFRVYVDRYGLVYRTRANDSIRLRGFEGSLDLLYAKAVA